LCSAGAFWQSWLNRRTATRPNRRAQISELTKSLKEALDVTDSIRTEVSEGEVVNRTGESPRRSQAAGAALRSGRGNRKGSPPRRGAARQQVQHRDAVLLH